MQPTKPDILQALDAFIRKYYKNLLLRGILWTVGLAGLIVLAAVLVEHFGWLPRWGRALLFWGGLLALATVATWLVVRPLLKMHGLGKRISHQQAAIIIGRHFPEVADKLLNLLQLMDAAPQPDSDLLVAAIEQKGAELRPVPFLRAINLKSNKKYLKYALPPLAVIGVLLLISPRTVTAPAQRIANYRTEYQRPAPFEFRLLTSQLVVLQGNDYVLQVGTEGEARPGEVWLCIDDRRYKMQPSHVTENTFEYTFRQVRQSTRFHLEGGGVRSVGYNLQVLPNPTMLSFRLVLDYPAYTGRPQETIAGVGDAEMPEGTRVRWYFQTQNADSLVFIVGDSSNAKQQIPLPDNGRAEVQRRIMQSTDYAFYVVATPSEGTVLRSDTLTYRLSSIRDAAPHIAVDEMADSLYPDRRHFHGRIRDDYGFTRLAFVHRTISGHDTLSDQADLSIDKGNSELTQDFYFTFNTAELNLAPGDVLEYWFEVTDNDAIHGPKTSRSQTFETRIPTEEQLDSMLQNTTREMNRNAQNQMSELRQMQQEIDQMMQRLVEKKELSWQDRKELEQLAQRQKQLRESWQQLRQQIDERNQMEQRFREQNEQLLEKQRELDRLMNEVMDEKIKETMREIERMMKEIDKKKVQQELEQIKMDNEALEKQLDQNIDLMKQLEMEKRIEQTIQKIDQLAEKQRQLANETAAAENKKDEQLLQKQDQIGQSFDQLKKEVEQLKADYEELNEGSQLRIPDSIGQQADQHMHQAGQQMQRGKNKQASDLQRQAADDMERLSEAIARAQTEAEQENLAEDAAAVRRLLNSLVQLSMNQEELIDDLGTTYIQDPRYQTIIARQNRIRDDFREVGDSLRAIARRQIQVASAIAKNLDEVNSNTTRSLQSLLDMNQSFYGSYRNSQAARPMQYSMTSLNNLALILAESLDKMQNQMRQNAQQMKSGQCKNPGKGQKPASQSGKGKGKAKNMRQMQEQLNKQMEALRKQLEQEGKSGGSRHELGKGQPMSEELARMAAQQEAIRRMMQQYGNEMKESSGGDSKLAREVDQMLRQMEQTETELVNRTITRKTMERQKQIMTRMLEHEKAEMQREQEPQRESREGSDLYSEPSPAELQRWQIQQRQATDGLPATPPQLQPYYQKKAGEYFFQLN